uniref:Uncharacterized protein LOC100186668 n=1 Tax=Phallusia mammillata TaxID=59560 RepID=A0A6F9DJ75_9ASCI|nr:uncharacterized protein LOC100186668 [Phallusia mammillata]
MLHQRPRSARPRPYRSGNRGNNIRGNNQSKPWANQQDSQYTSMGHNNPWGDSTNTPRNIRPRPFRGTGNFPQRPQGFQGPQNFPRPPRFHGPPSFQGPQNFEEPPNYQEPPPPMLQAPRGFQGPQSFQAPPMYQEPELPVIPPFPFDDGANWENEPFGNDRNPNMFQEMDQNDWNSYPQEPAENDWNSNPQPPPKVFRKNTGHTAQQNYGPSIARERKTRMLPKRGSIGPLRGAGRKMLPKSNFSFGKPSRIEQNFYGHEEEDWFNETADEFGGNDRNYFNEDFNDRSLERDAINHRSADYGGKKYDHKFASNRDKNKPLKNRFTNKQSKPAVQSKPQNKTTKAKKELTEEERKLDKELSRINVQPKQRQAISNVVRKVMQAVHPVSNALAKNHAFAINAHGTSNANGDKKDLETEKDDITKPSPDTNPSNNNDITIMDDEDMILSSDTEPENKLINDNAEKNDVAVVECADTSNASDRGTEKAVEADSTVMETSVAVTDKETNGESKNDPQPKSSGGKADDLKADSAKPTPATEIAESKPVQVLLGALACGHAADYLLFGNRFDCFIIIVSKNKPTQALLTETYQLLVKQFQSDISLKSYYLVMDLNEETITVDNHNIKGLHLKFRFTSPKYSDTGKSLDMGNTVQEVEPTSDSKLLDPTKCKEALSMIRRMRWFLKQRQDPSCHGDVLILRLFIMLTMQEKWKKFSLWQMMVLIPCARKSIEFQLAHGEDKYASTTIEPEWLFRRCLEILSSGALYETWKCIKDPVEKDMYMASWLSDQDAEDITVAAMDTLRELSISGLDHITKLKNVPVS